MKTNSLNQILQLHQKSYSSKLDDANIKAANEVQKAPLLYTELDYDNYIDDDKQFAFAGISSRSPRKDQWT